MTAMGNYSVLYYPHFQPSLHWLKAILLLVNEVIRIVPRDVDPGDRDQLKELIQEIPGCLKSIAPTDFDVNIDDINVLRMNKAFRQIRQNLPMTQNREIELEIKGNSISIAGHVFLHQSKVSKQIYDALIENNLVDPALQGISRHLEEECYLVPAQASNLILSYIADRIAGRTGLDSVTDENISFAVNTLDNMGCSLERPTGSTEGSLLSAIASVSVPKDIERITLKEYRGLRDSYAGIREVFKEYVAQLSMIHRLNRIEDISVFRNQLQEIAQKIREECDKYQKTAFRRKLSKWGLFTVCNLLPIASAICDPTLGKVVGLEALAIRFVKKVYFGKHGAQEPHTAIQMLTGMRKRILKMSTVRALA